MREFIRDFIPFTLLVIGIAGVSYIVQAPERHFVIGLVAGAALMLHILMMRAE